MRYLSILFFVILLTSCAKDLGVNEGFTGLFPANPINPVNPINYTAQTDLVNCNDLTPNCDDCYHVRYPQFMRAKILGFLDGCYIDVELTDPTCRVHYRDTIFEIELIQVGG